MPQPFWIEGVEGDPALVFYASPGDSLYSPDNVLILVDTATQAALPGMFEEQEDSLNASAGWRLHPCLKD